MEDAESKNRKITTNGLKKIKPPEITLQYFLILLSMFFSHKNFPSNTVIFRSPLSKQMKLLGLVGRQET